MPPDRILEARKTYAELAEACRSLREQSTALENTIASLRTEVSGVRREMSRLHDEVDEERQRIRDIVAELAADIEELRRVLKRPQAWRVLWVVMGGFVGAFLFHAAADGWKWMQGAFLSWWTGQ